MTFSIPTWTSGSTVTSADVARWELGGAAVPLRAFPGANDDARLAAAFSYCASQTYTGIAILFDEAKQYVFNNQILAYTGMRLINPYIGNGQQAKSGVPLPGSVKLNMSGGWLTLGGANVNSCVVSGLSFDCASSARVVEPGGQMFYWRWDSIGFQNGLSIIGSDATKQGNDGIFFTGTWNVNNVGECAFNIGGSDSQIRPTSMYLDSPNWILPNSSYLFKTAAQTKTGLSGLYLTADQHSGVLISAGARGGMLRMNDCTVEGRNAGAPCYGALVRIVSGAAAMISDCQFNFAMTSPSSSGHGDLGYVHVANGFVNIHDIATLLASGQTQSIPVLYVATGSTARVRAWDAWDASSSKYKPVVQQQTSGLIDADSSVTVVTG